MAGFNPLVMGLSGEGDPFSLRQEREARERAVRGAKKASDRPWSGEARPSAKRTRGLRWANGASRAVFALSAAGLAAGLWRLAPSGGAWMWLAALFPIVALSGFLASPVRIAFLGCWEIGARAGLSYGLACARGEWMSLMGDLARYPHSLALGVPAVAALAIDALCYLAARRAQARGLAGLGGALERAGSACRKAEQTLADWESRVNTLAPLARLKARADQAQEWRKGHAAMARCARLGPVYAWDMARARILEGRWLLAALCWEASPFDPGWEVRVSGGQELSWEGVKKGARSYLSGRDPRQSVPFWEAMLLCQQDPARVFISGQTCDALCGETLRAAMESDALALALQGDAQKELEGKPRRSGARRL